MKRQLVVLLVGALTRGRIVVFDEHVHVAHIRSYGNVADVDQAFLGGLSHSGCCG